MMPVSEIALGRPYMILPFVAAGVGPVTSSLIVPTDVDTVSIVRDETRPNSSTSRAQRGKQQPGQVSGVYKNKGVIHMSAVHKLLGLLGVPLLTILITRTMATPRTARMMAITITKMASVPAGKRTTACLILTKISMIRSEQKRQTVSRSNWPKIAIISTTQWTRIWTNWI
jgi:hypothetical protein